jgi:hypothetical protein
MNYLRHNHRSRYQHKTISSHACSAGFKMFTMKLWAVEEWSSLKQIIFFQSSHLKKHFRILKTKHSLLSPFVVLSNHLIYVVFLDPHQGIDSFAFLLPTSKILCGAQVGINMKTYLHYIYCKVKIRIKEKNVIPLLTSNPYATLFCRNDKIWLQPGCCRNHLHFRLR